VDSGLEPTWNQAWNRRKDRQAEPVNCPRTDGYMVDTSEQMSQARHGKQLSKALLQLQTPMQHRTGDMGH